MAGENKNTAVTQRKPLLFSITSLVEPTPDVNYDFVSGAYLAGSILALIFYSVQLFCSDQTNDAASDESKSDDGHLSLETMKELAESLEGIYLIFIPFIPCLLWSLIVRAKWKGQLDLKKES
uniref:Uncharacterized protein n=1 Tax=Ditylum brightwellii TaxID=49249 RepID=A0A7S1ZN45_9STRA